MIRFFKNFLVGIIAFLLGTAIATILLAVLTNIGFWGFAVIIALFYAVLKHFTGED